MKRASKTVFTCDKCLKEIEYTNDDYDFAVNECWEIQLGRAGYGSKFDGSELNFDICDDCLHEFVNTFSKEGKKRVYDSGINSGWFE